MSMRGDGLLVLQTEELDAGCRAWLLDRCRVEACAPEDGPKYDGLLSEASGLVIRTYTRVDAGLLDRAPKLKVVGRAGVGLDNVDVKACRARGVEVVYTPDANTRAVVELVTAFLLDAVRPRLFLDRALAIGEWKRLRSELIGERQLAEMTLGILGLGRVGRGVARVGAAMNMPVIYHDVRPIPLDQRVGATGVELEELFSRADVLSVHVDDRASNRGFVNGELLKLMKPGAMLINTSRGFVIENTGLAAWLDGDASARAILDVHEPEPFDAGYPLLGKKNAYLTPHIGAATRMAHRNMSWVVRDVWRVLSGERAEFPAP